nr:Ig domain-containing protein [Comamonas koreensis]
MKSTIISVAKICATVRCSIPLFVLMLMACLAGRASATEIQGQFAAGESTQTGRLNRFAVVSTCSGQKGSPGMFTAVGTRVYQQHTLTNNTGSSTCVTVREYAGTCGTNIFSAAYNGTFTPSSPESNYLADPGSSVGSDQSITYSFNLANTATAQVIVHEVNTGTAGTCTYTLEHDLGAPKLSLLSVAPVGVTTATLKATSDVTGIGYWVVYPKNTTAPSSAVANMPTAAEVRAGSSHGSLVLVANGSKAMTANTPGTFHLTGLVANTDYEAYLMVEDAGGNRSLVSDRATFTTESGFEGTIGGTASGIVGTGISLAINAGTPNELLLAVHTNGGFAFEQALAEGASYAITVKTQPSGQLCTVANGSGTMGTNSVTNVAVDCVSNSHRLGGSLSGLVPGQSITLQNNSGDNLTLSANGPLAFNTLVNYGVGYHVSISSAPAGQTCSISGGSGTMPDADVSSVIVSCAANPYTVGGTIAGLRVGGQVTVQNNDVETLVRNADGAFTFTQTVEFGSPYAVTVTAQPADQTCTVTQGSGTMEASDVSNVAVNCVSGLTIATKGFGNLQAGQAVSGVQLSASGGSGSYMWSATDTGQPLPAGLSLSASGLLTGTPTSTGSYSTLVTVTDSSGTSKQMLVTTKASNAVSRVFSGTVAASVTSTPMPVPLFGEWWEKALLSLMVMMWMALGLRGRWGVKR